MVEKKRTAAARKSRRTAISIGVLVVVLVVAMIIVMRVYKTGGRQSALVFQPWSGAVRNYASVEAVISELQSSSLRYATDPEGQLIPLDNYNVRFSSFASPTGKSPAKGFRLRLYYSQSAAGSVAIAGYLSAGADTSGWRETIVTVVDGSFVNLEPTYV